MDLTGLDKEIEFKEKQKTFKEIEEQYLDTSKLKKINGWKAKYNIKRGLKLTIKGYEKWYNKK
jgi:nucleoside-diphosphate-sugar epimerase